ncbi:hypothetical protein IGI04_041136, partial [Brassica rapa subsp. trilocularis]
MSSEANCWLSSEGLASVLNPQSSAPGGLPPKPPDPPDPSLSEFPPLSPPIPPSSTKFSARSTIQTTVKPNFTFGSTASLFNLPPKATILTSPDNSDVVMTDSSVTTHGSAVKNVESSKESNFTILPPKQSSPILTNRASSHLPNPIARTTPPPVLPHSKSAPIPTDPPPISNPVTNLNHTPETPQKKQKSATPKPHPAQTHTYASKAKLLSDRSLKRLAPTICSPEGKPRVLVPDAVFARGAALHKEYIVGSFLGKMPDYGPIQSVLNYMWGKGSKLEIHLQPLKHSMLVRVPNDYIRTKILEKKLWYVDTSMFYVSQWGENPTVSYPEITSIPLWAHLRGVPFDLRTKEGLSLAAGLVGEPIETDDYTKNISSLNVAHVKIEANLCKPLPTAGELLRENGEVIEVDIDYPWTPPLCSHCCRIGHIVKNCIYPAATASQQDNAANATASVSLQGYSPHAQLDKEVQNKAITATPPLLTVHIPPQIAVEMVDRMQEDQVVANTSSASTILESESQLAVDLIADATPLSYDTETITVSPIPSLPSSPPLLKAISLAKSSPPSPKSSRSSPQKALSLTKSTPSSPTSPSILSFTSSASNAQFYKPFSMNTKLTFWNVRGLNEPTKHQPFSQWLYSQRTVFCALLETHIKEQNLSSLMQKLCPGWSYTSNHASDEDGRIILIWNHPVSIQ